MNILPLVFALVMVLMVMTIEKIDSFKNQSMVETAYQQFLTKYERQEFNLKQRRLYEKYNDKIANLNWGALLTKTTQSNEGGQQDSDMKAEAQIRLISIPLMDILYGHADFYQKVKDKRENLPEELLDAIKKAVNEKNSPLIKDKLDIAWLKLEDPELQEVFYHMLKGTVSRDDYKQIMNDKTYQPGKAYVSLLYYVNKDKFKPIEMAHAPLELLKAIFEKEEDALAFMKKRSEINRKDSGAADALKAEFIEKRRQGLEDTTLDFKISKTGKSPRNYD
jgi:hypothetical protein